MQILQKYSLELHANGAIMLLKKNANIAKIFSGEINMIKRDYLLFQGIKKENIISIELVRLSFGKLRDPYRF